MKLLIKTNIKWFEDEQRKYGTHAALHNFIWTFFAKRTLQDLGHRKTHIKVDKAVK